MLAHHFADVRGRSETRLSKPFTVQASSPRFAVVLVGNCHVTVKSLMADLDTDGQEASTFADGLFSALADERLLIRVLP
jgi:hypothetical protein